MRPSGSSASITPPINRSRRASRHLVVQRRAAQYNSSDSPQIAPRGAAPVGQVRPLGR